MRIEAGLTQKQVAQYLACSRSAYSKYELELREFPFETAILIADLYEISIDYLLGRVNERAPYPKSSRK